MLEHRSDDDVDTDQEVYVNAIRQVKIDVEQAEYEVYGSRNGWD